MLDDGLLLLAPKAEVELRARRQLCRARGIGQADDGLVVCVLQDALGLISPDDNRVVGPSRGEVLSVLGVVDSENLAVGRALPCRTGSACPPNETRTRRVMLHAHCMGLIGTFPCTVSYAKFEDDSQITLTITSGVKS